jgi:hypothetical protein
MQLAVLMQLPRGTSRAAKGALLHWCRIASIFSSYPCRIRGSASICGILRVMKLSYADCRHPVELARAMMLPAERERRAALAQRGRSAGSALRKAKAKAKAKANLNRSSNL